MLKINLLTFFVGHPGHPGHPEHPGHPGHPGYPGHPGHSGHPGRLKKLSVIIKTRNPTGIQINRVNDKIFIHF